MQRKDQRTKRSRGRRNAINRKQIRVVIDIIRASSEWVLYCVGASHVPSPHHQDASLISCCVSKAPTHGVYCTVLPKFHLRRALLYSTVPTRYCYLFLRTLGRCVTKQEEEPYIQTAQFEQWLTSFLRNLRNHDGCTAPATEMNEHHPLLLEDALLTIIFVQTATIWTNL